MVVGEFILWAKSLLINFSYPAMLVIGFISSSTLFLPLPIDLIILFASAWLNPWLVGILAGIGAGFGEITGYLIGAGGRYIVKEKKPKSRLPKQLKLFYKTLSTTFFRIFKKIWFFIIITASFVPFSFDFIGILTGAMRYDMRKFLIAAIIGKIAKYLLLAFIGSEIAELFGV